MADDLPELTSAQREIVGWLWAREVKNKDMTGTLVHRGGDLCEYYRERWAEANPKPDYWKGEGWARFTAGSPKMHSWRRQGGLQLQRLADKRWLEQTGIPYGVPVYEFTDRAKLEMEHQTALEEAVLDKNA